MQIPTIEPVFVAEGLHQLTISLALLSVPLVLWIIAGIADGQPTRSNRVRPRKTEN